jgi:1-acyl-sn-glycerol-3-phosphate acyltransferase
VDLIYRASCFFFHVWLRIGHDLKVYGRHNRPKKGPFICASNHLSLADPPVLGSAFWVPMNFMAKKELFMSKVWGWWFRVVKCIPISSDSRDFNAAKIALKQLENGYAIAIFPEGTRSETGEFLEPEVGAGFLAAKSRAPVIPVYIWGSGNVLPKGGKYKWGPPVRAFIGKPVDFSKAEEIMDRREKYNFMSKRIMQEIAGLKQKALEEIGK